MFNFFFVLPPPPPACDHESFFKLPRKPLTNKIATRQGHGPTNEVNLFSENVNAPVIDGVNTANLVLVDQGVSVGGSVDFADYLEMKDVTSDTGVLDGCDVVQVS